MRSLMKHVLLLGNQGAAPAWTPTYIVRADFTSDESAPMASPHTAEPGPGELTMTQVKGSLSASGGKLVIDGTGVTHWGNQGIAGTSTRAAGRALYAHYNRSAHGAGDTHTGVGWMTTVSADTLQSGAGFSSVALYTIRSGSYIQIGTWSLNTDYYVAHVLWSTGSILFIREGAGVWKCRWIDLISSDANVIGGIANRTPVGTSEFIYLCDFPAPFDAYDGFAAIDVAAPDSGTEYTGVADAIIDLTVTAPGTLDGEATTRCGFYYRADADLTPAWHIYFDGTGAFRVDSIASDGTRTNRTNAAGVITGGGARGLRVICDGSTHTVYTLSGTAWTRRNVITLSLNNTATTVVPEIPAGWSADNLRCWPVTSAAYDVLSTVGN